MLAACLNNLNSTGVNKRLARVQFFGSDRAFHRFWMFLAHAIACSLGVQFGDANIVHTLGQCIDGPTTHFTSLVTLGYLGIIPNLAMGTIWAVSLFCAEKNGGSNHFEPWFFIAIVG